MAEKTSLVNISLEDLEKKITCAICQEHYVEPKVLPCLHYYCKQCIHKVTVEVGIGKPFSCPECDQTTTLLTEGKEELKPAFVINRLKPMFTKRKKALSKQVSCEICRIPQAAAVGFCQQCDKFACQGCVRQHSVMVAVFEGHHIFTLDEFQVLHAEVLLPKSQPVKKCEVHDDPLKVFCFDCNKQICRDCTVKDHRDHKIEFNTVAAKAKKAELLENVKPLSRVKDSLSDAIENIRDTEKEVKAQEDALVCSITSYFDDLKKTLTSHKLQLIEELKRRVKSKIINLEDQEQQLTKASKGASSVIEYTEQFVQHCADNEIMSMHAEVSLQIKKLLDDHQRSKHNLEPVESANLKSQLNSLEILQNLCLTTKIKQFDAMVISKIPKRVNINDQLNIIIRTRENYLTRDPEYWLCSRMENLVTNNFLSATVHRTGHRELTVIFTPDTCGMHKVNIEFLSEPLMHIPFSVLVSNSPVELMREKAWEIEYKPICLAVNSAEELVIVDSEGNIQVFDQNSESAIDLEEVRNISGLALDHLDNIFFIDCKSADIVELYQDLSYYVYDSKSLRNRGRKCISIVGEEVMVLENSNEGEILVFDKKINYQRNIQGLVKTELDYLTSDSHGNLFVSSYQSVQVIKTDGAASLLHFDIQGPWSPSRLLVSGSYLYVTNRANQTTMVFTNSGKYVAIVDNCAGPMCVDQYGCLYIFFPDIFSEKKKIYRYY